MANVCVHVRVYFTHVTDMGQSWLLLRHTPTGRLFSKRIFSKLQITITELVMWNRWNLFFLPASPSFANNHIVFLPFVFTMADRNKKRNTDWRLQLLRGELCPLAEWRSSTASAIPTWKSSHLLHATTRKMLVSSSIPSTHKQFCLFMPLKHGAVQCDQKPKDCIRFEEYRFLEHCTQLHTTKEECNRIWCNLAVYLSATAPFLFCFPKWENMSFHPCSWQGFICLLFCLFKLETASCPRFQCVGEWCVHPTWWPNNLFKVKFWPSLFSLRARLLANNKCQLVG